MDAQMLMRNRKGRERRMGSGWVEVGGLRQNVSLDFIRAENGRTDHTLQSCVTLLSPDLISVPGQDILWL